MPPAAANSPGVKVEGVNDLLRALSRMDKALNAEVRDRSQVLAQRVALAAQTSASTPLARAVASQIRARRDRVPVVALGPGKLSSGTPVRDVMFGAEFGGRGRPSTRQFQPHLGKLGYFLYPTVRSMGGRLAEEWFEEIADTVGKYWHN